MLGQNNSEMLTKESLEILSSPHTGGRSAKSIRNKGFLFSEGGEDNYHETFNRMFQSVTSEMTLFCVDLS